MPMEVGLHREKIGGTLVVALYAGSISDATLLVATDEPQLVEIVKRWFDSNTELECIIEERNDPEHVHNMEPVKRPSEGDGISARAIAVLRLTRLKTEGT